MQPHTLPLTSIATFLLLLFPTTLLAQDTSILGTFQFFTIQPTTISKGKKNTGSCQINMIFNGGYPMGPSAAPSTIIDPTSICEALPEGNMTSSSFAACKPDAMAKVTIEVGAKVADPVTFSLDWNNGTFARCKTDGAPGSNGIKGHQNSAECFYSKLVQKT